MTDQLTVSDYADAILFVLDSVADALQAGARTLTIPDDSTCMLWNCVDLVRVWDGGERHAESRQVADSTLEVVGMVIAAGHTVLSARASILGAASGRLRVLRDMVAQVDDILDTQLCPGPDERRMRRGLIKGTDALVREYRERRFGRASREDKGGR